VRNYNNISHLVVAYLHLLWHNQSREREIPYARPFVCPLDCLSARQSLGLLCVVIMVWLVPYIHFLCLDGF